jgi:BirA family biotin operon repressor/biotin-[acetyl-CoA-carboxylase] ligase
MTAPVRGAGDLPVLPPWYRLVALDSCGSTNDEAKALARDGAPEGTLVWARRQDAGRGRRGRAWSSEAGNLYLSLVLRPHDMAAAAQLSFVAAVAVGEAVAAAIPGRPQLKWPNDVLVDGAKIAGILLEAEPATAGGAPGWLVVGIGLNVSHHPEGLDRRTTDLTALGASAVTVEAALSSLAAHFQPWYDRWRVQGFAPARAAWLNAAYGLGGPVRLVEPGAAEPVAGSFADLDADGALMVRTAAGLRRITAGDVHFG